MLPKTKSGLISLLLLAIVSTTSAQTIYLKGFISTVPRIINSRSSNIYTSYAAEYMFNTRSSIFISHNNSTLNDRLGYNYYLLKKIKYLFLNTSLHRRYLEINGNVDVSTSTGIDIGMGKKFMLTKLGIEATAGLFAHRQEHKKYISYDAMSGARYGTTTTTRFSPYLDITLVYKVDLSKD